jgi:hypothetical protein
MRNGLCLVALCFLTLLSIPAASCRAGPAPITLGFLIGGSTPTTIYELPGSTFLLSVVLTGSGQQLVGVDYHFLATPAVSSTASAFTIISRNSQNGMFTNPYESDQQVMTGNQMLAPDNSFNLGANTTNYATLTATGAYDVADFDIQVLPTAPVGAKYTFSFSNINSDVLGYDTPSFAEASFTSTGSFTVYTPEPRQGVVLCGLCLLGLRRGRRRPR